MTNVAATNTYGFHCSIAAGSNKWAFYAGAGAAASRLSDLRIGQDAASGSALLTVAGQILSTAGNGNGYATGAGGSVTQATSRTTGVTLNTPTGAITLVS